MEALIGTGALIRMGALIGMEALIGIGALINKNTFEGEGRFFERRCLLEGSAKSNHYD